MAVTLPEALVEDVMEKLPAKSLMRFKSVKRSWNALFKTNSFIKRHSQRQRQRGSDEQLLIVVPKTPKIMLLSPNQRNLVELPATIFPFSHNPKFRSLNSFFHCHGVICLNYPDINEEYVLWNPATREVKLVPRSSLQQATFAKYPQTLFEHRYGFGADSNNFLDFKIVHFFAMFPNHEVNINIVPHVTAQLYSTTTNSWALLHDLDVNYFIHSTGYHSFDDSTFANGVFHWLSSDDTFILCFDFHSNQFYRLSTPSTLPGSIVEVGDSIAYAAKHSVREDLNEMLFEIWILKQDSSWTKICKVGPLYNFVFINAIWNNGAEFLVHSLGHGLVSHNSDGKPLRQFQISSFLMNKYVESIASLSL